MQYLPEDHHEEAYDTSSRTKGVRFCMCLILDPAVKFRSDIPADDNRMTFLLPRSSDLRFLKNSFMEVFMLV